LAASLKYLGLTDGEPPKEDKSITKVMMTEVEARAGLDEAPVVIAA
jgi:hypothetical protein